MEYKEAATKPPEITASLNGTAEERAMYVPSAAAPRVALAEAIVRWRKQAPEVCQKAHENAANKPQDELEAQVLNEKSTYERRANARRRLESTGKLVGLEMKVTNEFAVDPYRSQNPADELWEKFEEMRNIGPSMQGSGVEAYEYAKGLAFGLSMSRATSIFEASSPKCKGGNEPRIIASIARSLKKSAESSNAGGRVEQMAAARSVRRAVEIEALMNERKKAMLTNGSNSVWAAGLKEPPPSAIGNAIPWMPRPG